MYTKGAPLPTFAGVLLVEALLLTTAPAYGYHLASVRDAHRYGVAQRFVMKLLGVPDRFVAEHGWSRQIYNPALPMNRTLAKSMTLCVPLIAEDAVRFRTHFVKHLNTQTLKPSELVVAISGVLEDRASEFEASLRRVVHDIPVVVTSVSHKARPGENRNRCVAHSHGDIITFFDGDDAMHSRRIEILDRIFQLYNPKVVVHQYSTLLPKIVNASFEVVSARTAKYEEEKTFRKSRDGSREGPQSGIAQGWPTISRDVFDRVRYNETMKDSEDVKFLSDILEAYGNGPTESTLVCLNVALGEYTPRRVKHTMNWLEEKRIAVNEEFEEAQKRRARGKHKKLRVNSPGHGRKKKTWA